MKNVYGVFIREKPLSEISQFIQ